MSSTASFHLVAMTLLTASLVATAGARLHGHDALEPTRQLAKELGVRTGLIDATSHPSADPSRGEPEAGPVPPVPDVPGPGSPPLDPRRASGLDTTPGPVDDDGPPTGTDTGGDEASDAGQPDPNRTRSRNETSSPSSPPEEDRAPLGVGLHVNGLRRLDHAPEQGPTTSEMDYGQVWVGAWNLEHGFSRVDRQIAWLVEHDITPVIQFYYWGNDIDKACLEEGCAGKTVAGWSRLARELGTHLEETMNGQPAIVVLEPEFNKGNVATHEPLDAALAKKADELHDGYPNTRVALGMGGWAPQLWETWDRAMEASDLMGIQLMRASTQDSRATYADAADTLVRQAAILHEISGKPVIVNDVALATYPGPPYLDLQAQELEEIFDATDDLQEAQVEGLVYRALLDDPSAPTAEYYGEAETTWGLRHANGTAKPALAVWRQGVAERA